MSTLVRALMFGGTAALAMLLIAPQKAPAQDRYWNTYWDWYDDTYRTYYNRAYHFGRYGQWPYTGFGRDPYGYQMYRARRPQWEERDFYGTVPPPTRRDAARIRALPPGWR